MPKTITGTWLFDDGTPIAGGRLFLSLSNDAVALGVAQVVPKTIVILLDANGKIPTGTTMFANDELKPDGTFYTATILDSNGAKVWGAEFLSITGTSPIDLTTLPPGLAGGVVIFATFAQLNVIQTWTAVQTFAVGTLAINPGPLTLASAATAARTATFPDNTGTVAEINLAQTWSAVQTHSATIVPNSAGSVALGTSALPWSAVFIGGAPTNNIQLSGTATAARTATLPDNTGTVAELNLAQTWTAAQTIAPATTGTAALTVNAPTGQTVDILDVQLNAVNLVKISKFGEVTISPTASGSLGLTVQAPGTINNVLVVGSTVSIGGAATGTVVLTITGASGQVANMVQVNTFGASTLFTIGASGSVGISPTATNVIPLFINAASGQTVNNFDVQVNSVSKFSIEAGGNPVLKAGAAPTVSAGQIGLGSTTSASATAGGVQAVPATVAGYVVANIAGTNFKIPYFSV